MEGSPSSDQFTAHAPSSPSSPSNTLQEGLPSFIDLTASRSVNMRNDWEREQEWGDPAEGQVIVLSVDEARKEESLELPRDIQQSDEINSDNEFDVGDEEVCS